MFANKSSAFFFLLALSAISKIEGCTSNVDCPHGQCCGSMIPDVFGLLQSCQVYSQEGEGCHGSLIGASCDCTPGLTCAEHTGIFAILHTSNGICVNPNKTTNPSSVLGIFGK